MNPTLANLNPFQSALVPAMAAEPVTTLSMNIPVSVVAGNSSELADVSGRRATTNGPRLATRSLGTRGKKDQALIPDPTSGSLPIPTEVGKLAAGATLSAPAVFLERTLRNRSLPYSNNRFVPDFDALYNEIVNGHPRDLDLHPPPLFLRKPSKSFLRSLYQIAGVRT